MRVYVLLVLLRIRNFLHCFLCVVLFHFRFLDYLNGLTKLRGEREGNEAKNKNKTKVCCRKHLCFDLDLVWLCRAMASATPFLSVAALEGLCTSGEQRKQVKRDGNGKTEPKRVTATVDRK